MAFTTPEPKTFEARLVELVMKDVEAIALKQVETMAAAYKEALLKEARLSLARTSVMLSNHFNVSNPLGKEITITCRIPQDAKL